MSKAEERALEKYPKKIEWIGNQWNGAPFDVNSEKRFCYQQGYKEAEEDLKLTGQDMLAIFHIVNEVLSDIWVERKNKQEMSEEVLKRFKDFKERKENGE